MCIRDSPYFRASSLDKSNKEVYSLITSLSPTDMKEIISGENTFFTATIPRTNNDSKAIVLIAQLDDGTESTFFKTNGIVRLYIFNYLEPLGTTCLLYTSCAYSQNKKQNSILNDYITNPS